MNKNIYPYFKNDLYEIPIVWDDYILPENEEIIFRGFNEKPKKDTICHFFLHDYQFERVWNKPKKYLNKLKEYKAVLTPDFSLFTDYPIAVQIWNTYRNRWLGAYWQHNGIDVIPTISWSTKESYDFCFNGIKKNSIVAISTLGCLRNKDSTKLFVDGYNEMIKQLSPEYIFIYGENIKNNILSGKTIQIKNDIIQKMEMK